MLWLWIVLCGCVGLRGCVVSVFAVFLLVVLQVHCGICGCFLCSSPFFWLFCRSFYKERALATKGVR